MADIKEQWKVGKVNFTLTDSKNDSKMKPRNFFLDINNNNRELRFDKFWLQENETESWKLQIKSEEERN